MIKYATQYINLILSAERCLVR